MKQEPKRYRTKELDYDARHHPKTDQSCVRCQRDIKPGSPTRSVHLIEGGVLILHPEDEALYVSDRGDCGSFLVGMGCARIIGMEWTTAGFAAQEQSNET